MQAPALAPASARCLPGIRKQTGQRKEWAAAGLRGPVGQLNLLKRGTASVHGQHGMHRALQGRSCPAAQGVVCRVLAPFCRAAPALPSRPPSSASGASSGAISSRLSGRPVWACWKAKSCVSEGMPGSNTRSGWRKGLGKGCQRGKNGWTRAPLSPGAAWWGGRPRVSSPAGAAHCCGGSEISIRVQAKGMPSSNSAGRGMGRVGAAQGWAGRSC